MYTILQISDLHRSRDEPVDNDTLVAALLGDRDRYIGETPIVPSPDAIVVSGDLIQGAPIGAPNWQDMMRVEASGMTVSRWELGKVLMNTDAMQAVADALGIEPEDLWHHPDQPTPNQLLRDQPPSVEEQAINLIRAIRRS